MKNVLANTEYVLDSNEDIWSRPDYRSIDYSDGDEVELRIGKIIKEARDLSVLSTELRHHCYDWPSIYHLSSTRANILRPFSEALSGDVLEVGSGCGAITRYLGECGGNILTLEGSRRRAIIAAARVRNLQNVTVLAEDFGQFECSWKFDVITLIGVLEYANLFMPTRPPSSMLRKARSLLKPNGRLIIAIENQLGLKYFSGAPEDHLGKYMYGIEGRYKADEPQTFGRVCLANMLTEAGFSTCHFLSPLPDYKMPVSIITEHGLSHESFDAEALALQSTRFDHQLPIYSSFSLDLAWPQIFKNRLALDLANSFLIVASPRPQELVKETILAYHFSTERKPEYCREAIFIQEESGRITVQYSRLADAGESQMNNMLVRFTCPESAPYFHGKPVSHKFIQIVTKDNWSVEEVGEYVNSYLETLKIIMADQGHGFDLRSPTSLISGDLFDAVPQNLIITEDGSTKLIDKEWEFLSSIEIGYLLFRGLLQNIDSVSCFGSTVFTETMTRRQFLHNVLLTSGLDVRKEKLDSYIKLETDIQEEITGHSSKKIMSFWQELRLPTLNLNQALASRDQQLAKMKQELAERDIYIKSLLKSKSWRLTLPFRAIHKRLTGKS